MLTDRQIQLIAHAVCKESHAFFKALDAQFTDAQRTWLLTYALGDEWKRNVLDQAAQLLSDAGEAELADSVEAANPQKPQKGDPGD